MGGMLIQQLLPDAERPMEHPEHANSGTFHPPSGPMESEDDSEPLDCTIPGDDDDRPSDRGAVGDDASSLQSGRSGRSQPKCEGATERRSSLAPKIDVKVRIMDRDATFGQSLGHWEIRHFTRRMGSVLHQVHALYAEDWYHTFLDAKIRLQLSAFAFAFVLCFGVFAVLYLMISEDCGLDLDESFVKAYLLSLETMMTIGYGVPDPYMKGCWQAPIVLTAQLLLQVLMTSCLVGVVFQGISRPQARACTIIFSENATIRCIDGAHYLMLRVCDLRSRHSLVEAHVRCYCVRRHPSRGYELVPMRLEQPDDELGGMLLMTLPTLVVHRIDAWSPLVPSRPRRTSIDPAAGGPPLREAWRRAYWPGVAQRQGDCDGGNRDCCVCPTCGESFEHLSMLQLHCKYNAKSDEASGIAKEDRHYELGALDVQALAHVDPSREEIRSHLSRSYVELVVLVEGIEPTTSSTLQARHSYVLGGLPTDDLDVVWDKEFADCTAVPQDGHGLGLDLGRFHLLVHPASTATQSRPA